MVVAVRRAGGTAAAAAGERADAARARASQHCRRPAAGAGGGERRTAQSRRHPRAAATAPASRPRQTQSGIPTIVANANLVNVSFSVQTRHGEYVPGLTRADFRVFEDGRPEQIRFFSAEQQLPLTLGWLIDTSPSQERLLEEEQVVSREF